MLIKREQLLRELQTDELNLAIRGLEEEIKQAASNGERSIIISKLINHPYGGGVFEGKAFKVLSTDEAIDIICTYAGYTVLFTKEAIRRGLLCGGDIENTIMTISW